MRCPACGTENPDRFKFCPGCGGDLLVETLRVGRRRTTGRLLWFLGVPLFMATMVTSAGIAIYPGSQAWLAPLVCGEGHEGVVVLTVSHPEPGTTTWTSDLFCVDPEGRPFYPDPWVVYPVVFGLSFVAFLGFFVVLGLLRRARAQRAAYLVLPLLLTGCGSGTISAEEFEELYGVSPWAVKAAGSEATEDPGKRLRKVDLFHGDAEAYAQDLRSRYGGDVILVGLRLYDGYAVAEVVDMETPGWQEETLWKNGHFVQDATKRTRLGETDVEAAGFLLSQASLERVAELVPVALERMGWEEGVVNYAFVRRSAADGVVLMVSVEGAGVSGTVYFSSDGELLRSRP